MLCFDASRLARNGRDWHHLLELCGLVDARVIDWNGDGRPDLIVVEASSLSWWENR